MVSKSRTGSRANPMTSSSRVEIQFLRGNLLLQPDCLYYSHCHIPLQFIISAMSHRIRASLSRTCIICSEEYTLRTAASSFPTSCVTDGCTHASSTCLICIEKTILEELFSRGWDRIQCPECPSLLDYNDVRRFATAETFNMFVNLAL